MSNNASKSRDQALLSAIARIRNELEQKGGDPGLLDDLEHLEKEIAERRYGLVFEEHDEEADILVGKGGCSVSEVEELSIGTGEPINVLCEGENLLALAWLASEYQGRIDLICIDPPYNTGMTELRYDDSCCIDKGDEYPHSKWLSFMDKRLRRANELLANSGSMFICIDENEIGVLILLCQAIFGEDNVDVLVWPKVNPRFDRNRKEKPIRNFRFVHEYIVVCFKDRNSAISNPMHHPHWDEDGKEWVSSAPMETIVRDLGTTSSAKDEMEEFLGERGAFSTPKPMRLMKEIVRVATNPDSIVLDFFAGSGTIGHAVMDLNKEDGGNRRFILVTNNENGICRNVAQPRLRECMGRKAYRGRIRFLTVG
jgi:DNA modification methylase